MVFIKKTKSGFGMVEVIIGATIISIAASAIMLAFQKSLSLSGGNLRNVQGSYLAEEGIEAVKILRDESWQSNIAPLISGVEYYLEFSPGAGWTATTTPVVIDGVFYRTFQLGDVYRDAVTDDITTAGGVLDIDTYMVSVTVSWPDKSATSTRSIATYITNLFSN